ncbi:MAG TPA: EutN/CcmL family microcompartment protein [Myxococcota bacterium]|nr:EutN/CcmL family microcompartment protein [Myxococcota bacterium]HQK50569.1 EutN/CcmL family microcompartment protein [Myxococcota bacterium]
MILARVIGPVWGARQSPALGGRRVLEVRRLGLGHATQGEAIGADCRDDHLQPATLLAVDALGSDAGQLVLVAVGSRVRDLTLGPEVPTKNVVVAIVDEAFLDPSGTGGAR